MRDTKWEATGRVGLCSLAPRVVLPKTIDARGCNVFRNRCKVAMAASGLCLLTALVVVGLVGWTPGKARATSAPIENGWLGTGTPGATVGKANATSAREGKLISVV